MRPVGALLFGRIGDMVGRKYTFLVTIVIMGASTFLVGLLPSYTSIGVAAPIILIDLRLLQGLALGGEYGGAATYVAEHAPMGKQATGSAGNGVRSSVYSPSRLDRTSATGSGLKPEPLSSHAERRCQLLRLAEADPFFPLSSGVTNPIGRLGGSGGVMSSRSASKTSLS